MPSTWYGWTGLFLALAIIALYSLFHYVWKEKGGDDDTHSSPGS